MIHLSLKIALCSGYCCYPPFIGEDRGGTRRLGKLSKVIELADKEARR